MSAFRDPGTNCSQILTQNFHKTGWVDSRLLDRALYQTECPFSPLYSSSQSWKSDCKQHLCWLRYVLYGRPIIGFIHVIGYSSLPAIVTSRSPFVLRTLRRNWYPSAPHYLLHVWDPWRARGRDHSQSQHHVRGFPSTSGLMYWISCQFTVFQICLCALCYCTGSCCVCSHQVLVGQPTNKKLVSILPQPSPLLCHWENRNELSRSPSAEVVGEGCSDNCNLCMQGEPWGAEPHLKQPPEQHRQRTQIPGATALEQHGLWWLCPEHAAPCHQSQQLQWNLYPHPGWQHRE